MKKISAHLLLLGMVLAALCLTAGAAPAASGSEETDLSYFSETFSDKKLSNNRITNQLGKVIWQINTTPGQTNSITDTGALQLGGAQFMQRAVLAKNQWGEKQEYAVEFTVNVQKGGNEGHEGRPICIVIPRTKDTNFTQYYAVSYYMENTVANRYRFKWAIINTAAPTGMEPLAEGYYVMQENVDYTGRISIRNTEDGNVNIRVYLDGPTSPARGFEPFLEYTDTGAYKILSSAAGPAFGAVGYSNDGWGTSPVVRYDNIRLFELDKFEAYGERLNAYAAVDPQDIASGQLYREVKYLANRGIVSGYQDDRFLPDQDVSAGEFMKMLLAAKGETLSVTGDDWSVDIARKAETLGIVKTGEITDYSRPITKYQAALMIAGVNGNPLTDSEYSSNIKDFKAVPQTYQRAVLYTFYEGYLRLNDKFQFNGTNRISRAEAADIIMRVLDAGYRKINYKLELPSVFSPGAVFQANKKIPVWGRGFCGDTITVSMGGQVKKTEVKNGYWSLELDPMSYGGPYSMMVKSNHQTMIVSNIQIGEVFIVAGQSNAEMFLKDCNDAQETINKFKNKRNLRFFWGEQITAVTPNFNSVGKWESPSVWVLKESPAIATFFVENLLELNPSLKNVAIGIIRMTYGGTTIEAFMPDCIDEESNYVPGNDEPIMSGFWNGFMNPISPFAVSGVFYYQGENSTQLGYGYETMLRNYLRGLRTEFQDPNLPVILVQLAGFGYSTPQSDTDEWPKIREIQMKVADTTPNTGLVTAVDLSDPDPLEIHPKDKKEIGRRLANLAMGLIYGQEIKQRSAELNTCTFRGNRVIADFHYDYGKLYLKENTALDFQVLDLLGGWHAADAAVSADGVTLEIWSDEVPVPMGVRYAWVNNPNISLYNGVDLPALPFRVLNMPATTEYIVKLRDHALKQGDAIVNTSRDNIFRAIMAMDQNTLTHVYSIAGQQPGDTLLKLSRLGGAVAQAGTTETVIRIQGHGLQVGDWVRNDTCGWEPRAVTRVLDEDTFEVAAVKGQQAGDEFDLYRLLGEARAE